jgi:hypothetical protein
VLQNDLCIMTSGVQSAVNTKQDRYHILAWSAHLLPPTHRIDWWLHQYRPVKLGEVQASAQCGQVDQSDVPSTREANYFAFLGHISRSFANPGGANRRSIHHDQAPLPFPTLGVNSSGAGLDRINRMRHTRDCLPSSLGSCKSSLMVSGDSWFTMWKEPPTRWKNL